MPDQLAIRMENVSKNYRLHGSQADQLIDVLGLQRFGLAPRAPIREFAALSDITLDVPRGHRVGIVGRNGAGKTTLLKLVCGNLAPTGGLVEVHGSVQALMNVGLGFHPDYTGRENVAAALQYSGLANSEYREAMDGIIEFSELGEFLDQPFKTYSSGMQARLMFAAATALRPDILIVDEVLGAGDAYFVAKSKLRVQKLVGAGCTLLLVSHSLQQVLELCEEAIWLEHGRVRMRGAAFLVVKAYEESIHGPPVPVAVPAPVASAASAAEQAPPSTGARPGFRLQEPVFMPHRDAPAVHGAFSATELHFVARGGLSRWQSSMGVKLCGLAILTERGLTNSLTSLRPAQVVMHVVGEAELSLSCRYGIVFHDLMGNTVCIVYSPPDRFDIRVGELRKVTMLLNPLQLGPGEYTMGISILEATDLELVNEATRFDLLGRSFSVSVGFPDSLAPIAGRVFHSAEWEFSKP